MKAHILGRIAAMPAGKVFFATDMAELMEESVYDVSHILSALAREGRVLHLTKGIYAKYQKNAHGDLVPLDRDRVIAAIVRHYRQEAVPKGLSAAWQLGLLAERPALECYAVRQGEHRFRFADWQLELQSGRQAPFLYRTELASLLVTALPAIGEPNLTAEQAAVLKRQIVECPDREAFRDDVLRMPLWIKKYLRRL